MKKHNPHRRTVVLLIGALLLLGNPARAAGDLFVPGEWAAAAVSPALRATSLAGTPILCRGANGQAMGIVRLMLDGIGRIIGLTFTRGTRDPAEVLAGGCAFFLPAEGCCPCGNTALPISYPGADAIPLLHSVLSPDQPGGKSRAVVGETGESQTGDPVPDAMSGAGQKASFPMLIDADGRELSIILLLLIGALLLNTASYMRINRKLSIQNRRHEQLAYLSNEYLYEYFVAGERLSLSEKCLGLFETPEALAAATFTLKQLLSQVDRDGCVTAITLPLSNGRTGVFKAVNACIRDGGGRLDSIVGKLIDVSTETAEKEALILKSQTDGLTGLYNASTAYQLVSDYLGSWDRHRTDAFLLVDCDNFKKINDTFGHLVGDRMLAHICKSLKCTFRSTDIMGRVGGDEFIVYLRDIPSADFVWGKCLQLRQLIQAAEIDIFVSVSIGVALVEGETTYEAVFKRADDALYQAKRTGKDQVSFAAN